MKFHPVAVSVVAGALGSSSTAEAFVLPKSARHRHHPMTMATARTGTTAMAAKNDGSEYTSLEDNLFNGSNKNFGVNVNVDSSDTPSSKKSNNGAQTSSTPPKKTRKPNPRTEKLRAKLEADLTAAEQSRARTAEELARAESSRLTLEREASKAAKEAEALEAKFNAFEAKETARAGAGGASGAGMGAASIVGEIAGPLVGGFAVFGGLGIARNALAARSEKAEEERLQREEEQRQAEEAAKRKTSQQSQTQNFLPIVGVGVAGLGAVGAFFGSGNSRGGGGGDTVVDAMSKNALQQAAQVSQQNTDSAANVELPYLENKIAKAETKQKVKKERPPRPKTKRQLALEAAKERKATEARLEKKLAEAPELALKAEAEAKGSEEARLEAEKKALTEKEAAQRKTVEEKAIEEKKAAAEKKASDEAAAAAEKAKAEKIAADKIVFEKMKAEEKAKSEKLAADQKRVEEERAKSEKIAADRLAFEKLKAEQKANAEQKAKEAEAAAALQLLKQQEAQSQGFFPKVPAVSEMLFGDNRPSLITDKGLSSIFSTNKIVVGGVALVGAAVAAAVVAANESPSVSSTFKVTGKTPKEYLESEDTDANGTSPPKKTVRIPKPGNQESQASPEASLTPPLPGSKEALREELAKNRASLNRQAAEKSLQESTVEDMSSLPMTDATSTDPSNMGSTGFAGPAFVPPPAKKSFSPFGGGKPKAVANDPLYSPPGSQSPMNDVSGNASVDQPIFPYPKIPAPELDSNQEASFGTMTKKSFSPFGGGGKPKAVVNDFLYSAPASSSGTTDASLDEPLVQPVEPISDQSTIGGAPPATVPKNSYSPFGGGKPKAAVSDSLYAPPDSQSMPESMSSHNEMGEGAFSAPTMESDLSSFEESYPEAAAIDSSDYAPSLSQFEPITAFPASSLESNSSPPAPKNYSPFGGGKPFAATNDSLYSAPTSAGSSGTGGYNVAETEPTIVSFEAETIGPEVSAMPSQNFSPFGGAKPTLSFNDSLYSPPTDETFGMDPNQGESLPFASSGLDEASSAGVPETNTFRPPSVKKSFSPFGSKPQAPSDTSENGGGYLGGL